MRRRLLAIVFVLATLTLAHPSPVQACPNCKDAVAAQEPAQAARLKNGYFYSILLMVSMPVVIAGTGLFFVIRAARRGGFPEL